MKERKYASEYDIKIDEVKGKKVKKKLEYNGEYFVLDGGERMLGSMKSIFTGYAVTMFLLYITGAAVDFGGSRTLYVVIPYAVCIFPMVFLLLGVGKLYFVKYRMEHIEFDSSIVRIGRCLKGLLILPGVSAVGELVYLLVGENGQKSFLDGIFLTAMLLISLFSYLFLINYKKYSFTKSK